MHFFGFTLDNIDRAVDAMRKTYGDDISFACSTTHGMTSSLGAEIAGSLNGRKCRESWEVHDAFILAMFLQNPDGEIVFGGTARFTCLGDFLARQGVEGLRNIGSP